MSDVFTVGDRNYRFVPDSSFGTCEKCVFHKKPHSCKASDFFDSGVLPQCDADGIGEGYFIECDGVDDPRKGQSGICPTCGSDNVDFGDTEYGYNDCGRECSCKDCQTRWVEVYRLDRKVVI